MFKSIFLLALLGLASAKIPFQSSGYMQSVGIHYLYGDEEFHVINQVMKEGEKDEKEKSHLTLVDAIPPLPVEDVKCLMSVDRFCSKHMLDMKNILIHALKEDCKNCTAEQKEQAGTIVASMMAHDPSAWKLFLTRSELQKKPPRKPIKEENVHYVQVGKSEVVANSKRRFVRSGVKVRVKRVAMKRVD